MVKERFKIERFCVLVRKRYIQLIIGIIILTATIKYWSNLFQSFSIFKSGVEIDTEL